MVKTTLLAFTLGLLLVSGAHADVPDRLHYQGYLTNTEGEAVDCPTVEACPDESFTVTFRLYGEAEGGDPLWEESHESVAIDNGVFHLELGSLSPLDASLIEDPSFIGVEINGSGEMSPRQRVTSAAFSMRSARSALAELAESAEHATMADNAVAAESAQDAEKLGGYDAMEYALITELPGLCVTEAALSDKAFWTGEDVATYLTESGYVAGAHLSPDEVAAMISDMSISGLSCEAGQVVMYDGIAWMCMTLGDADTLADLSCQAGDVAYFDGDMEAWTCGPDKMLTPEQVDDIVSDKGYAMDSDLAPVAKTGSFTDLIDMPEGLADGDDDTQLDEVAVDQMVANNGYAMDSDLSPVAKSGDYADLTGVPSDLGDGDDDTLAGLACMGGELAFWDDEAGMWACGADRVLSESEVDAMADNNGYALDADLALVAKSGSFTDLIDVPLGLADGDDDTQLDEVAVDQMVANNGYAMDSTSRRWLRRAASMTSLICPRARCGDDDTQLDEVAVDQMVANNGYAMDSGLSAVAKSGDYADSQASFRPRRWG